MSDMSGVMSLYAMDQHGSLPEALVPAGLALQNPHLMLGGNYFVLPKLRKVLVMVDKDGNENYQPCFVPLEGGIPEPIFGSRYDNEQTGLYSLRYKDEYRLFLSRRSENSLHRMPASIRERLRLLMVRAVLRLAVPLSKVVKKFDVSNMHPVLLLPLVGVYLVVVFMPFFVAIFLGNILFTLLGISWLIFNALILIFRDTLYDSEALERAYIGFTEDFMGTIRQKNAAEDYVEYIKKKQTEAAEKERAKTKSI